MAQACLICAHSWMHAMLLRTLHITKGAIFLHTMSPGTLQVSTAALRFRSLLDALPDADLNANVCIVSESVDTDQLGRRSMSDKSE